MPLLHDKQFFYQSFETVQDFEPVPGSIYITGTSDEPRALEVNASTRGASGVSTLQISEVSAYSFTSKIDGVASVYSLRSTNNLDSFWQSISTTSAYLDITGLPHHIWAPMLKSGLRNDCELMVVYVEPEHYQFSVSQTEGDFFDLSEKINGVAPIPGFATLSESNDENVCFVPLLGFEGIRLAHILEQVQPPGGKITPIIGIPGFAPEYPFYAYQGNRRSLLDSRAWKNARFACASNPFSLFFALEDISGLYPRDRLKIAPIGTKPHALGAILYALASSNTVEIVYDHPIRKAGRTTGSGRLFVYDVSSFMST